MDRPSNDKLKDYLAGKVTQDEQRAIAQYLELDPGALYEIEDDDNDDVLVQRIRAETLDFSNEPEFLDGLNRSKELKVIPSRIAIPSRLGHFEIYERMKSGGASTVCKAIDIRNGKSVAIKLLAIDLAADCNSWNRFQREASMVESLSHPNIVRFIESGILDESPFFTTELLTGFDLSELVARTGPLDAGVACAIIRQVADALQFAAGIGLVHRDVKPSNIFLTEDGEVKLLDLGVARYSIESGESSITHVDQVVGTMDYMAPEQAFDSRKADVRSDIYGLGCTLYKLLTGRAPFAAQEYQNMSRA